MCYRGAKTIVVHEGYKPEMFDKGYNDIALIKFDRPFFPELLPKQLPKLRAKMMPICLPHSYRFKDQDKQGER